MPLNAKLPIYVDTFVNFVQNETVNDGQKWMVSRPK